MDQEFSQEQLETWNKFLAWQKENVPRVAKMKEPLTIKQFLTLLEMFGKQNLIEVLEAMHNKADLHKKYVSAYLTARNWCKRAMPNQGSEELSPVAKKIKNATKQTNN